MGSGFSDPEDNHMSKSNIYPIVAPGFPSFIPVSPTSKPPGRWREWGRSPQPAPIHIGLPRATSRPSAQHTIESATDVGTTLSYPRRTDIESDSYPRRELPPELKGDN
jgi:hypothetical protein